MKPEADIEARIATHVASAQPGCLTASTVRATCRDILDTFGCLLGGRAAPGIGTMRELVQGWGGRPEATIVPAGPRVPAPQAALVNGAMAHALDFDDTHDLAGSIHPGAPVLAASIAAAQLRGGVRGDEFVLAVAIGLDLACRIALAARHDRGWHRTAAIGVFGAAAAASRLLGLDPPRVGQALGIALSQAAGTRQCIDDGAMTKRFQAGQAASAGVLSAMLAAGGMTGAHRALTGRFGFFAMYQPDDPPGHALIEGLGESWEGDRLSLKPYPCFRPGHTAIDAAIALHGEIARGSGASVERVLLEMPASPWAERFVQAGEGRRPAHGIEAQFATPFLVAVALRHGRVGIDDVARVDDDAVLRLAERIECHAVSGRPERWARVTVTLGDGRSASIERDDPSGSPERPMSEDALDAKFLDCARHGAPELSGPALHDTIDRIRGLGNAADACAFVTRLELPAG